MTTLATRSRFLAVSAVFSVATAAAALAISTEADSPQPSSSPLAYMGINLASGEFAPERVPGIYEKDYVYPARSTAAPFVKAGFNIVRVPVLWERLQPEANGPLDPQELRRLDASMKAMSGFRTIILDLHNYGRYHGAVLSVDRGALMLGDFWTKVARHYRTSPRIAFGLMNEPHGIVAGDWRTIMDRVTSQIRSTGVRNLLLIPGTRWTGAHSWTTGPGSNAAAFTGFRDPANNFMFEVHQYLDADSSGQSASCVNRKVGSRRLAQFTRWARREKARALLGEFGGGSDPVCVAALDDLLDYMGSNRDVWSGATYWAGGDWWGEYPFSIQPQAGRVLKPQLQVLLRRAGRRP